MVHHHLVSSLCCLGAVPGAAWPKIGQTADVAARLQTGDGGLAPASAKLSRPCVAGEPAKRPFRTRLCRWLVPFTRGMWEETGQGPRLMRNPRCRSAGLLKPPFSRMSRRQLRARSGGRDGGVGGRACNGARGGMQGPARGSGGGWLDGRWRCAPGKCLSGIARRALRGNLSRPPCPPLALTGNSSSWGGQLSRWSVSDGASLALSSSSYLLSWYDLMP